MKRPLILLLSLFLPGILFGQELSIGTGIMFSSHSPVEIITDSLSLSTTNEAGRKYLIPQLSVTVPLSRRWSLSAEVGYRRHTISMQAWDNRADTCTLCPLKKGIGPTFHELRISSLFQYRIFGKTVSTFLISGPGLNIPFYRQDNAGAHSEIYYEMARASSSLSQVSLTWQVGMKLKWSRFTFLLSRMVTANYTRQISWFGESAIFRSREEMWTGSVLVRLISFKKPK